MDLWMAFTLGLFGSLHCAGMCGPLAMALPRHGKAAAALLGGRLLYNAGRTITYAGIGCVFGLFGKSLILVGFQRWLSIGLGVVLLAGWFASRRKRLAGPFNSLYAKLSSSMSPLLRNGSAISLGALGLLNGLLPCPLVYVAAAGATASGSLLGGAAFMGVFGLATFPMMLVISLSGGLLPVGLRLKLVRAIPVAVFALAALLILRGMSLGIPYLSPDMSGQSSCCHEAAKPTGE